MEDVSIALLCTFLGAILGYLNFQRSKRNDIASESKSQGITTIKLDYISKGVDDIRLDIKAQDRKIEDIADRLTRVEECTKSAHLRIDDMIKEE